MRIVYLHQYFTTPSMSGGTRSYEMARRLVAHGHEVHMVTSDTSGRGSDHAWSETEEAGIRVHWLSVPYSNTMTYRQRIEAFVRFAISSAGRASGLKPDVVFASSTPLTIAIPGIYASRRRRVPLVFEVRDLWPKTPIALGALKNPLAQVLARALERIAYRSSAHVIALSPGMRDGVIGAGYPPSKVTVIPNSCDFDVFDVDPTRGVSFRNRHAWLGERPLVVYTGTLGLVNGVGYLAHLAAKTRAIDPEVRFLVVGNGRESAHVESLAKSLGVLNETFFMIPQMPKTAIPDVLAAASITTSTVIDVPALWPNSANKFFDSLAASRPIAINHEGWQADLIREHDIGLVLDPHDHERAATELVRVLHDRDWLQRAGRAARVLGEARFSRDDLSNQLESMLRGVV